MTKFVSTLTLLIFIVFYHVEACGQSQNENTITFHVGMGAVDGNHTNGIGSLIGIGYQQKFLHNRLRFNPNLIIGFYNNRLYTDLPDQYFNSISLEPTVFFDVLKVKAFALTLGAGGVLNFTTGLTGTGGENPSNNYSGFMNHWNYGVYLGGGIRINPAKGRIVYSFIPFNFHVGPAYYVEVFAKMGVEIKL